MAAAWARGSEDPPPLMRPGSSASEIPPSVERAFRAKPFTAFGIRTNQPNARRRFSRERSSPLTRRTRKQKALSASAKAGGVWSDRSAHRPVFFARATPRMRPMPGTPSCWWICVHTVPMNGPADVARASNASVEGRARRGSPRRGYCTAATRAHMLPRRLAGLRRRRRTRSFRCTCTRCPNHPGGAP